MKKEYIKATVKVINLSHGHCLLAGSGNVGSDDYGYGDAKPDMDDDGEY